MDLGPFSLSLAVKNLEASLQFYQTLGFEVIDGGHQNEGLKDSDKLKWRILTNQKVKIGLFQGMFNENIITFNPKDVLGIQENLKKKQLPIEKEANPNSKDGFLTLMLKDPDGNTLMLDQM